MNYLFKFTNLKNKIMNKKFTFKNYFLFFSLFILSAQAYSQSNDKDLNDENEQIIKTEKSDSSNSNMDTINLSSPSKLL